MRETRTWVWKVSGSRVATSSPGKRDGIFPGHVRSGARHGYRLPVGGA